MSELKYHLNQIKKEIQNFQRYLDVEFSDGVNQILLIIIKETLEKKGLAQLQPEFIDSIIESVKRILLTMKDEPSEIDKFLIEEIKIPAKNYRTSTSLIKSFSKNFCNIPPFCGRDSNYL